MRKFIVLVLSVFMAVCLLTVSPFRMDVQAEGTITNITVDANGEVRWDAYPGTREYDVYINGDYAESTVQPHFSLRGFLEYNYYGSGAYTVKIYAFEYKNNNWNNIAHGSAPVFNYSSKGQLGRPGSAWWDGNKACWSAVSGAETYFIDLYCDDTLVDSYTISDATQMDMSYYITGKTRKYYFGVSAASYGYMRSEETFSSSRYGLDPTFMRLSGSNRYMTSLAVAEKINEINSYYDGTRAVVIATGKDFPDALSGAYLAGRNDAPLLLISEGSSQNICNFVKNHVDKNGTIYILGGTGVLPDAWIAPLFAEYKNIVRIAGKNRYDTNLDILRAIGTDTYSWMLVCTGKGFADSLSASSISAPILLVGDKLTENQKNFLSNEAKNLDFYIIGGTGAVSSAVEAELANYGSVQDRIYGKNRYETSVEVAEYFFEWVREIVLATGKDFPDGLSGGPLGFLYYAPIILTSQSNNAAAKEYASAYRIANAIVLGGENAVSTAAVKDILDLK